MPAALLALGLAIGACSSDSSDASSTDGGDSATAAGTTDNLPAADADADPEVTISRSRFEPVELSVGLGAVVRFVNTDPFAHTVTATPSSEEDFDSGDMGEDDVFEISFDEPGTYSYFCAIHPTMRGVIEVG